jgi:predicted ATPase
MSTASSTNSANAYVALFLQICTEIQAPTEFIEVVGHDVLGFPSLVERSHEKRKADSMLNTIISFMAQLISHCTKTFDLTLLVLDNVHFMDEMSWKVVELIFEKAPNFLIICASQPLTSFQLTVDENFWRSLQNIPDRFDELKLKPLNDLELTEMIAHEFQCPKENVDEQFSRDIFMQSGGLPLYARELLGSMKQFSFVAVSESGKLGWKISPGTIDDVRFLL